MKDVLLLKIILLPQNLPYLLVPLLFATVHIYFGYTPEHDLKVHNKLRMSHIIESVFVLAFIGYFLLDIKRPEYQNIHRLTQYKNPLKV